MRCLIVEDDKIQRLSLKGLLRGHHILDAATLKEGKTLLQNEHFDVVFLDLDLDKKLAGLELTKLAKERGFYSIIVTGHNSNDIIEKAYRFGCQDYLTKPITEKSLDLVLNRYLSFESEHRIDDLVKKYYITKDQKTLNELNLIKKVGLTDKPILIKGATGTGKRIVAHLIRDALKIPKDQFVEINCAQFTETLFESEVFGHKKGSFTGAINDKIGLLSKADGGIVFLDEIHSLTKSAQQKLMKAIEEKEFYPVGGDRPMKSNFRVVCATCENLIEMVAENKFRSDFYARINNIQIELFPLKERVCDILPLIQYYLSKHERKIVITEEAKNVLLKLEWKSNTRDIEGLVDIWNIQGHGIITPKEIPDQFKLRAKEDKLSPLSKNDIKLIKEIGLGAYIEVHRKKVIDTFLDLADGNKTVAAEMLGLTRQAIGKSIRLQNKTNNVNQEDHHEQVIQ